MDESTISSAFLVNITGEIESAQIAGVEHIYCKYCYAHGTDWQIAAGLEDGISQIAKRGTEDPFLFVWNFPLEIAFRSTNVFGWPQLVISVYGYDFFGNDIVIGYGSTHVPPIAGVHRRKIALFKPDSSSLIQRFLSWFTGRTPEFVDPKVVSQSEGREVIRVRSQGHVNVKFNIVLKDFKKSGFCAQ